VSPVVQIGGIDKNKYTGAIDWIQVTQDSDFIVAGVTHSFRVDSTSPSTPIQFFQQRALFDTGNPNLAQIPLNDWNHLADSVGAQFDDDSGSWWFPCESTLDIDLHGSEDVVYTLHLADPNNVDSSTGLCAATVFPVESQTYWYVSYYAHFSIYQFTRLWQGYWNAIPLKLLSHLPL
jgi:hypothetical protein